MTQREMEVYCRDNGVPCHAVGDRLRVMDLSRLPDRLRAQFDERGFLVTEPVADAPEPEHVKPKRGKLPEDFPGHAALEAEGITTYAKVRKRLDSLTEIPGIGEATAEKIKAAMNESTEDDEEQDSE